ncbi:MAG: c-type cytochrome [Deltaproteobacteria bacterium]|nr:c-type cytochrome [Deltaproteobacteria bacterium]
MPKFCLLMTSLLVLGYIVFLSRLPNLHGAEETKGGITDEWLSGFHSILGQGNLYYYACATCHAVNGDGKGPSAYPLNPKPRDFTLGVYKCRSTPSGSLPTDEDIFKSIKRGFHGTKMPSWKPLLSEMHTWNLVEYIKTFSERFREEEPEEPIIIPEEVPVTTETIAEGKKLYEANKCWECHGHEGKGNGPKSGELKDDLGNRIKPSNITRGVFKCGDSSADIYRTIVTGMDGTPMPSYADSIQDEKDRWYLVSYIRSLKRKKNFFDCLFKND